MKSQFKLSLVAASIIFGSAANAEVAVPVDAGGNGVVRPANNGNLKLYGNTDSSSGTEGVSISSNNCYDGCTANPAPANQATAEFLTNGNATISATNQVSINGATNINTGANNTAATSINSVGTGNVTIGNAANTTTIQSGTNAITGVTNNITASGTNSANNVTGTTNVNTTGTATTSIGNANAAVNVSGTTKINDSVNAATSINTGSSTGAVNIGNSSNAANVTNINSTTNNIGAGYASTNNIGTGGTATTNNIGNSQTATQVSAQAGNAKMTLAHNSAVLTVPSGATGISNGVAVTPTQTTLTGGDTSPTRLTMTDRAATFSRASTGAPITVTGVADGRDDFDAINVRQFANAIAGVAALTNIPGLQQGQEKSIGLGVGSFMGKSALALGLNYRVDANTSLRVSAGSGLSGGAKATIGAGAAWSF